MKRPILRSWRFVILAAFLPLVLLAQGPGAGRIAIRFDGTGLASLTFDGTEFLSAGGLTVNRVTLDDASGAPRDADLQASTYVDGVAGSITKTFSWGTVVATYRAINNRLDISLKVANKGNRTIRGVFLEPLVLQLPGKPAEYDNVTPLMAFDPGQPGIVSLTSPTATVVLGNEAPGRPVLAGFPFAYDRPASTRFPLRVSTDRDPGNPTNYPTVDRPIAPGATDEFQFSLRFGSAGATADSLAGDVYRTFAGAFPATLRWTDRRPVGQLVLATSNAGYPRNPRGWLLDANLDVTTAAGLATFRTRVLAWASQSIVILKSLNAQGMITWDIEGEQYPHATTYLCDPRALSRAAPEMDGIADEYFGRFRAAGLRVGVCVRPQALVFDAQGGASQQPAADPAQVLIDKIAYAKARWGASLFYLDSNGDPNLPLDAGVVERVTVAHPDVLIIPEHENTRYYAYTAPYRELRQQQPSTPARVGVTYPDAFGVTYLADGDVTRFANELKQGVSRGDVLMTRSWFADPVNAAVPSLYALPRTPRNLRIALGRALFSCDVPWAALIPGCGRAMPPPAPIPAAAAGNQPDRVR